MKNIDRDSCKILRDRINAALAPLAAELGIQLAAGSCKFNDTSADFKLTATVKDASGNTVSKEETAFNRLHSLYGLPADALGKEINHGGSRFKITGLLPSRSRFPISATRDDGKRFCLLESAVAHLRVCGQGGIDQGADISQEVS